MTLLDSDDYYWLPTQPPFRQTRDPEVRRDLILADLQQHTSAVISGSVMNWGAEVEDAFSLIVFLTLDAAIRVARLRQREMARLGRVDAEFIEWAAQYETGRMPGRSRALHEQWLGKRSGIVLRIDGDLSVEERVARVTSALSNLPEGIRS
jgi:hypothetical protein